MKDKNLFILKFEKKLERNFKPSVKNLHSPKSSFFHCEEYMRLKIMSRVLVGFDETTEIRCGHTRTDGHGFFERLPHKSPFGAKSDNIRMNVDRFFDEIFTAAYVHTL